MSFSIITGPAVTPHAVFEMRNEEPTGLKPDARVERYLVLRITSAEQEFLPAKL